MSRDDIQRMMGGSERDSSEVLSEAANKALKDRTPALTQEADAALELEDNLSAVLHDDIDPNATAVQSSDTAEKNGNQNSSSNSGSRGAHKAHEGKAAAAAAAAAAAEVTGERPVAQPGVTTVLPDFSQRVDRTPGQRPVLVLVIALPLCTSSRDANIDVEPRRFLLRATPPVPTPSPPQPLASSPMVSAETVSPEPLRANKGAANKPERVEYLLSSELAETVRPTEASAKWNKKRRELSVTVPLV